MAAAAGSFSYAVDSSAMDSTQVTLQGFAAGHGRFEPLLHLALGEKFDGASINFRESVSMVPLSTFGKTFVKFA